MYLDESMAELYELDVAMAAPQQDLQRMATALESELSNPQLLNELVMFRMYARRRPVQHADLSGTMNTSNYVMMPTVVSLPDASRYG
jgi:hypothetical protein